MHARKISALAAAGLVTVAAAGLAQAADMPFPRVLESQPVTQQPVEWGTGWYLRGDIGYLKSTGDKGTGLGGLALSSLNMKNGYTFAVGPGYKFNNWFRTDMTFEYSRQAKLSGSEALPAGTNGFVNASTLDFTGGLNRQRVMVNAYLDLGMWSGVVPYIGAGFGFERTQTHRFVTVQTDTVVPAANPAVTSSYGNGTKTAPVWAAMAGVAMKVSPNAYLDFGYRYLSSGAFVAGNKQYRFDKGHTNEYRIGFRYMVD